MRPAAVAETHSAVVFFVGDHAYKAKKPVDLGFLDFRSLASRRTACHREVALNRRLAPDVYLGTAEVLGPDGEPCEYLVVMRRLPDDRRLSRLAADGADLDEVIREIADTLAAFHGEVGAPPAAARSASREQVEARWCRLVEPIRASGDEASMDTADRVLELARRYVQGRGPLFEARIAGGRARDGHGDLLADDVFVLDVGVRILDCLDFDEDLRCGDVLADVAFLAMDLERLGRADLATQLLDRYRANTDDDWPASLGHHYVAQRAFVRAGVSFIRAEQGDPSAAGPARRTLQLAVEHLEAARVRVVIVSGLPGTGKSTVAAAVASELDAVVLRTDEVRRAVAPAGEGRYRTANVDHTYGELLARAAELLGRGRTVVLDATWRSPEHRAAVEELAEATVADLTVLECVTPDVVADQRIQARRLVGTDPSEVTIEVADAIRAWWTPWPAATTVDTTGSIDASVAAAMAAVHRRPGT